MQKRTIKVALLAVLAIILAVGVSTVVLADVTWSDLPDTITAKYSVTDNQVAAISEGYSNGLWRPFSTVNRAQFTKMAVAAFNISLASPPIASYTDVPKGNFYYPYVEGAKAAGVVLGTTATTFSPNVKITRQQAIAIVARYIAKAQGFNLATMYSADDITKLLAHFADAASISADLRNEVAFAFDMGLVQGNDYGDLNPLVNLTRIQGAALLIRAQQLIPPNLWVPAKLELVSTDKTEGLIGQAYKATFKVTTAEGHPAKGVLVDFDTETADFYVGNIEPEAQVTDDEGEVTATLLSTEPGTQRLTATVAGLPTIYTTRYWLALDEVYNTKGAAAQNNTGVNHQWGVRVVVIGPGPRSTSVSDWYNAISTDTFDPTDVNVADGVDFGDYWNYAFEQYLATIDYAPRTLAGVNVNWSIYNIADNSTTTLTDETVTSVGNIVAVDGTSVTPAKTAVGHTDASGLSTITVYSEATGKTLSRAVADYAGNPYPKELFNHLTFEEAMWWHNFDWDDQPVSVDVDFDKDGVVDKNEPTWLDTNEDGVWDDSEAHYSEAVQVKTWIPHTFANDDHTGPISPAYIAPNVGEEKVLTLTLTDQYGNPVSDRSVEWFMQGVGFFQTDDDGDRSDPNVAANNIDYDVTDAAGKAQVFVKSYASGEQIVHAKVRDKGVGGAEGTWTSYTAEVQWFDADIATFDDITTQYGWSTPYTDTRQWVYLNEALSNNALGTTHTFTLSVYGLKLEYDPTIDEPDGQTPFIDTDYTGASYDGIFDSRDAEYMGGILMWPSDPEKVQTWDDKIKQLYEHDDGVWPYDANGDGIIEAKAGIDDNNDGVIDRYVDERGTIKIKVAGKWLTLSFEGAYTQYDYNDDALPEPFIGMPGIYLPLAGKTVSFLKANSKDAGTSNLGALFDGADVDAVETASPSDTAPVVATTDSKGQASITVQNPGGGTSGAKGPETVQAAVTWLGDPHVGPEVQTAYAKKLWIAGSTASATNVSFLVNVNDVETINTSTGTYKYGAQVAWTTDADGNRDLSAFHVDIHVIDQYGNDLPDYEIVYLLEDIDGWLGGTQDAYNTYIPWAYLTDIDTDDYDTDTDFDYDTNGDAPDSDEPTLESDPYAYIVGDGGTKAFFFNQWLGSEKPTYVGQAGLGQWYTMISGLGFAAYTGDIDHVAYTYTLPRSPAPVLPVDVFNGMDTVLEAGTPAAPTDLGLATDGAKAWTRDGYFKPDPTADVMANLFTGSSVDVQLADDITGDSAKGVHVESVLRMMVYPPSDGLVKEGSPIWSYQLPLVWEEPVPTTITLATTPTYGVAGSDTATLTATVLDQFKNVMPNVTLDLTTTTLEGTLANLVGVTPAVTDENGNTVISINQLPGDWGVDSIVATAGEATSNTAIVQWAYDDTSGVDLVIDSVNYGHNFVAGAHGGSTVTVFNGFTPWSGRSLEVVSGLGGTAMSTATTYVSAAATDLTLNTSTTLGASFAVYATNSSNTDGKPNWIYDVAP